jgi:hypothetical protein
VYNKKKKEGRSLGNQEIKEGNILEEVLENYEIRNDFEKNSCMYMCGRVSTSP